MITDTGMFVAATVLLDVAWCRCLVPDSLGAATTEGARDGVLLLVSSLGCAVPGAT